MSSRDLNKSRSSLVFRLLSSCCHMYSVPVLPHVMTNFHTLFDCTCTMTTRQTGNQAKRLHVMVTCALCCVMHS